MLLIRAIGWLNFPVRPAEGGPAASASPPPAAAASMASTEAPSSLLELRASLAEYEASLALLESGASEGKDLTAEDREVRDSLLEVIALTREAIEETEGRAEATPVPEEETRVEPTGLPGFDTQPGAKVEVLFEETWHPATVVALTNGGVQVSCLTFATGGTSVFEVSEAALLRKDAGGLAAASLAHQPVDRSAVTEQMREAQVRAAANAVVEGRVAEVPRAFAVRPEDDPETRERKRKMAKSFKGKVKRAAEEIEADKRASGWQAFAKKAKKATVARPSTLAKR